MRWLLALLVGLGIGGSPAALRAAPDQLVIGITQFPSTFHPSIDPMAAKTYILAMARRPFTAHDVDWQLACLLCTELPTLENGLARIEPQPDGSQGIALTYTIRDGATWGDGTPVSTADVLFTQEVGRHPQSGVTSAEMHRRLTRIDVIDARSFVLHIDRVTFDYNAINDFLLLPAHLERPIFEADPAAYRTRTLYDTDTTNPGLYFGPYRIAEVASGEHVVLEPNPTWWGEPPAFMRIVVRAIENTAALEANLLAGGVDMIAGEVGINVDQALAFEQRHGSQYRIVYKPALFYEHVDLNLDHPALGDRRVRQALMLGLDRAALTEQLFGGRQPVADTSVSPLDWVHTDQVRRYGEDLAAAGALLDEAGWPAGADGLRRNAAGEPLAFQIITTAGNRSRELVQQVLQSQWRRLGIELRIRNQPARVLFGETLTRRSFEHMALFSWISSPENVPRTILHSDQIPAAENGWSGQNHGGYRNPEMDVLLDQLERELDRDQRRDLWHRLQAIYAEDLPALPLFFRADVHIWPLWLEGVVPTGHQSYSSLWVERWRAADG
jgi:peptide/nickel transport system substrate-binding protein